MSDEKSNLLNTGVLTSQNNLADGAVITKSNLNESIIIMPGQHTGEKLLEAQADLRLQLDSMIRQNQSLLKDVATMKTTEQQNQDTILELRARIRDLEVENLVTLGKIVSPDINEDQNSKEQIYRAEAERLAEKANVYSEHCHSLSEEVERLTQQIHAQTEVFENDNRRLHQLVSANVEECRVKHEVISSLEKKLKASEELNDKTRRETAEDNSKNIKIWEERCEFLQKQNEDLKAIGEVRERERQWERETYGREKEDFDRRKRELESEKAILMCSIATSTPNSADAGRIGNINCDINIVRLQESLRAAEVELGVQKTLSTELTVKAQRIEQDKELKIKELEGAIENLKAIHEKEIRHLGAVYQLKNPFAFLQRFQTKTLQVAHRGNMLQSKLNTMNTKNAALTKKAMGPAGNAPSKKGRNSGDRMRLGSRNRIATGTYGGYDFQLAERTNTESSPSLDVGNEGRTKSSENPARPRSSSFNLNKVTLKNYSPMLIQDNTMVGNTTNSSAKTSNLKGSTTGNRKVSSGAPNTGTITRARNQGKKQMPTGKNGRRSNGNSNPSSTEAFLQSDKDLSQANGGPNAGSIRSQSVPKSGLTQSGLTQSGLTQSGFTQTQTQISPPRLLYNETIKARLMALSSTGSPPGVELGSTVAPTEAMSAPGSATTYCAQSPYLSAPVRRSEKKGDTLNSDKKSERKRDKKSGTPSGERLETPSGEVGTVGERLRTPLGPFTVEKVETPTPPELTAGTGSALTAIESADLNRVWQEKAMHTIDHLRSAVEDMTERYKNQLQYSHQLQDRLENVGKKVEGVLKTCD